MLVGGIKFVLGKVAAAVEAELNDDSRLREELLAAQMRFELGEMSAAELAAFEKEILARLRQIRERQLGLEPAGAGGNKSSSPPATAAYDPSPSTPRFVCAL